MDRRRVLRLVAGAGAAAVVGGLAIARDAGAVGGGQLTTTTALNLRSGPGTNRRVLRVIPQGAHVFDHGTVRNGFRSVAVHYAIDADATRDEIEALVAQAQKRSAVYDIMANPTNIVVDVNR